jgi:ribosomal protein S18 acetylase RimI-like enzyme
VNLAPFLTTHGREFRWMCARDMPQVLWIDRECFPTRPWGEAQFQKFGGTRDAIRIVAVDAPGRVLGYMVYVLGRREIRLVRLAVAPWSRREGTGGSLVASLVAKLEPIRRPRLVFHVREGNTAAALFYRDTLRACTWGRLATALDRGHYGDEDGYAFTFDVGGVQ